MDSKLDYMRRTRKRIAISLIKYIAKGKKKVTPKKKKELKPKCLNDTVIEETICGAVVNDHSPKETIDYHIALLMIRS
jgi:hypothetical protein